MASEPKFEVSATKKDINDNIYKTVIIDGKPLQVAVSPKGSISFGKPPGAGQETLARTGLGAFRTMNAITPVIRDLIRQRLRDNPDQQFKWSSGLKAKNALYRRYLRKFGIEASPEIPFSIPAGHSLRDGIAQHRPLMASAPFVQREIPDEKLDAFIKAARSLSRSGVTTPEALVQVVPEKSWPYLQALWNALGMLKPSMSGYTIGRRSPRRSKRNMRRRFLRRRRPKRKNQRQNLRRTSCSRKKSRLGSWLVSLPAATS